MKGAVFTFLNDAVEENYGLKTWDKVLNTVNPPSGGIYTAAANYDDCELFSLIGEISKETDTPADELVFNFGEYLLLQFAKSYPVFFQGCSAKEFLKKIDDVVHVEVRKLYKDVGLPEFSYEDPSDSELVMIYKSPRKLCHLAKGLINGTAQHYDISIINNETACLHNGDIHCRFELRFE